MSEQTRNIARAFLYGFTGIGLFRRLKPLGVPMEFVDTRDVHEAVGSGDYSLPIPGDRIVGCVTAAVQPKTPEQVEHERRARKAQATH